MFRREIKQNRLQLPSEQKIFCICRLGLGLASSYSFLQNKKVACFRRLGLGLAFNQLSERLRSDPEQYLLGRSNGIIYSCLRNEI